MINVTLVIIFLFITNIMGDCVTDENQVIDCIYL